MFNFTKKNLFVFFLCFFLVFSCLLAIEVVGLRKARVDGLAICLQTAHPIVLLIEDVAAAVAHVGSLIEDNLCELHDVALGLRGRRGRRRRSDLDLRLRLRIAHGLGGWRRGLRGRGRLLCLALLLSRGLCSLAPLALGLLRGGLRHALRVRACLRGGLASARGGGSALLGRRPLLETGQQVRIADALIVRNLLAVLLNSRQGALDVLAVLLTDKALELAAALEQHLPHVLRELNPTIGLLLRSVRVTLLLRLLHLLGANSGVNLDTVLGRHSEEGRQLRRGQRERDGHERGHFAGLPEYIVF